MQQSHREFVFGLFAVLIALCVLSGCQLKAPLPTQHYIRTADGMTLHLRHYAPVKGVTPALDRPVVLCHGLSYNSNFWRLRDDVHLPRYFQQRGVSVWTVSLRGNGFSSKPLPSGIKSVLKLQLFRLEPVGVSQRHFTSLYLWNWNIDDHAREDVPTVVHYVLRREKRRQLHWIGHSMGGMSVLANLQMPQSVAGKLASLTAVGSPIVHFPPSHPTIARLEDAALAAKIITGSGIWSISNIWGVATGTAGEFDELFYNRDNVDRNIARRLHLAASEDIAVGALSQLLDLFRTGEFRSIDGRQNYASGLAKLHDVPVSFVSGAVDPLAPPKTVEWSYLTYAGPKRLRNFSLNDGDSADYGHNDLIIGKHAAQEVYPYLLGFCRAVELEGVLTQGAPPIAIAESAPAATSAPVGSAEVVSGQPVSEP